MSNAYFSFCRARSALLASVVALATASCSQSRAAESPDKPVRVRIDSMGVAGINIPDLSILMYAEGDAFVTFGTQSPQRLVDTVRLRSVPSHTLDVSNGAVHVELVGGQLPGGGVVALSGHMIGADAVRMRAVGRHLVVERGGKGIRVVERGNPKLKPIGFDD